MWSSWVWVTVSHGCCDLRSSRNSWVWECLKMPNYSGEFSPMTRSSSCWRTTWNHANNMLKRPDRYRLMLLKQETNVYVQYNSLFLLTCTFPLFICPVLTKKKNIYIFFFVINHISCFCSAQPFLVMPLLSLKMLFAYFACIKQISSSLWFALWMQMQF